MIVRPSLIPQSLFDLSGRTALVTGSNGGLGFTIARGLARAGAKVILNGRNREKLDSAVKKLTDEGFDAAGYDFDVTDSAGIEKGLGDIGREIGSVDILVNNAGIQKRAPLETMTEEAWRTVIDTNLTSAFLVSRRVVGGMIGRKRGKIINICSLMSDLHRPTTGNYSAAKAGLKMLTRAMAVEWAKYNIQANAIGPGYFLTDLTEKLRNDPEFDRWIRGRTPAGRWGDPEELVGTAVFLASDASSFVNGQIIYIDGGLSSAI